jgi:hypothetical protein
MTTAAPRSYPDGYRWFIVATGAFSENGVMPSSELLTKMGSCNEELLKAGVRPEFEVATTYRALPCTG